MTQKSTIGQSRLDDDIMKKVDSQKWSTMRFEGLTQEDIGIEKNDELEHKRTKIESSRSSTTTQGVTVAQGRPHMWSLL